MTVIKIALKGGGKVALRAKIPKNVFCRCAGDWACY